jgi:hypothetical protein
MNSASPPDLRQIFWSGFAPEVPKDASAVLLQEDSRTMSQKMLVRSGTIPQAARPGAQIRCGHAFRLVDADVKAINPHFDCRWLPHRSRAARNRAPSRGQKNCKRKRRSRQPISTFQCGRGSAKNGGRSLRTRRGIRERGAHCSVRVRQWARAPSMRAASGPGSVWTWALSPPVSRTVRNVPRPCRSGRCHRRGRRGRGRPITLPVTFDVEVVGRTDT